MPDDFEKFLLRLEGGPHDGRTMGSTIVDPEELPAMFSMEGEVYERVIFSRLPPHPRVLRGALYRHVPSVEAPALVPIERLRTT